MLGRWAKARFRKESFWSRQFGVPEVVRHATRMELTLRAPRAKLAHREPAPPTQRARSSALFERSVIALLCGPVGLIMAVGCRRDARAEIEAIAERRCDPSGRTNAVIAYWMAQFVLWFWWLMLALNALVLATVGLLFATGVVH
jgi:hypothetical protein